VVVPVLVFPSGGLLLKFHWARVSAEALNVAPVRRSRLRMIGFICIVWLSWFWVGERCPEVTVQAMGHAL
jgi:hypothetical protein